MANWTSYIESFYRQDSQEQASLWSELTPEQQGAFLAACNAMQASTAPPERAGETRTFDPDGAWRLRIARELRAADLAVDLNKLG